MDENLLNRCFLELSLITTQLEQVIDNIKKAKNPDIYNKERDESQRKWDIYKNYILPRYGNDPDKVPPHLEPDYNEGWK